MKTDKQRIEELERRVKELEARPPVWMPVPYPVPQPYPVYPAPVLPLPSPWIIPWTPTYQPIPNPWIVTCGATGGTAMTITAQ
jgi:hypothetical protein